MNRQVKGFLTDALLDQPLCPILVTRRYQSVYDELFLSTFVPKRTGTALFQCAKLENRGIRDFGATHNKLDIIVHCT
jgi:hypothetical protein